MSQRWGSAQAEPGYEDPKGLGSGSSRPEQCPRCPGFYLTHLGTASAHPGRGHITLAGFARDALHPPLHQPPEQEVHTLQSHIVWVETEAQREASVEGLAIWADEVME